MKKFIPIDYNCIVVLDEEEEKEDYYVIEGFHMNQTEIAKELGCTRGAISFTIKNGLAKLFYFLRNNNKYLDPVELLVLLSEILNVKTNVQFERFFRELPKDIKSEVEEYARENYQTMY